MSDYLCMRGITKTYQAYGREVRALKNVDFSVRRGTVHGLLGENGAGKSTLMKILSGVERMDSGTVTFNGEEVTLGNAMQAQKLGIGMVHQHFSLIDDYTVAENVVLGMEPTKKLGFVDLKAQRAAAEEAARQCGFTIDLDRKVGTLSMGERQKVEIMRVVFSKADLLIFDEPTSVLVEQEIQGLLDTIRLLKENGKTIIYISHKVEEVISITDDLTVLRDGESVRTDKTAAVDAAEIIRMMVGQTLSLHLDKTPANPGNIVLQANNLWVKNGLLDAVKHVSFTVRSGEIVAIAGINGNGQPELLEVLFGLRKADKGSIRLMGKDITNLTPQKRRDAGMSYVPEDRIHVGSCATASVSENLLVDRRSKEPYSKHGFLKAKPLSDLSKQLIDQYSIKVSGENHIVGALSGGHIQRTILARELSANPKVLLASEVTMGLDVLSTRYVHETMLQLRDQGLGILLVSSNINEILALADRILVIHDGALTASFVNDDMITREEIGEYMLGIKFMTELTRGSEDDDAAV